MTQFETQYFHNNLSSNCFSHFPNVQDKKARASFGLPKNQRENVRSLISVLNGFFHYEIGSSTALSGVLVF